MAWSPPVSRVDVILPVLDEALALPSVLAAMPEGYRPIVVDNGSTDGSGDIARGLGALVVHEPRRGFGAACWTGLMASEAEVVAFMDCDGSLDASELPRVAEPVVSRSADLVLGRRLAERGAWPPHSRLANRVLARTLGRRAGVLLRDLGPMRAAPRADLLRLGICDRRFGWPLEMVVRAQGDGWRIEEVPVGYAPRIGRSKVTGTVRGTARAVRDMSGVLRSVAVEPRIEGTILVIAKEPAPGRVKTRLTPPLQPAQAATLAEAALADTLDAVASVPARRVLALDGAPGSWLPAGFEVAGQADGGLDRRLAVAVDPIEGPVLVIGMDTPQVTPELIADGLARLGDGGPEAVFGPATDGGYWALGLREASGDVFTGVPMSESWTGRAQLDRLAELGLEVSKLPTLRDVDTIEDAAEVAAHAPQTRFGRGFEALGVAEGHRWIGAG